MDLPDEFPNANIFKLCSKRMNEYYIGINALGYNILEKIKKNTKKSLNTPEGYMLYFSHEDDLYIEIIEYYPALFEKQIVWRLEEIIAEIYDENCLNLWFIPQIVDLAKEDKYFDPDKSFCKFCNIEIEKCYMRIHNKFNEHVKNFIEY